MLLLKRLIFEEIMGKNIMDVIIQYYKRKVKRKKIKTVLLKLQISSEEYEY